MEVQVRLATPEDAKGIQECLLATVAERVWLDRDECEINMGHPEILREKIKKFRPDQNAYIVATDGKAVVGFILLMRGRLKSTQHTADFGMSLLYDYRDRGFGTKLVQEAINWATKYGLHKLYCCSFHTNQRAINLYRKMGFEHEGTRKKQYNINGEYVDQLLFGKLLM